MIPDCYQIADSQRPLRLYGLTEQQDTKTVRCRIADCCNEPTIYKRLLRRMLDDRRYSPNDPANFIKWAAKGWRGKTRYVLVALDSEDLPIASCDMKTATRDDGTELRRHAHNVTPQKLGRSIVAGVVG